MRKPIFPFLLLALFCTPGCSHQHLEARETAAKGEVELAPFMGRLQRFSQKLGFAIRGENAPLAAFYLHELHEIEEDIEKQVPEHDGHKIADLCKAMLAPMIRACEQKLDNGTWEERWTAYGNMIQSCNACHTATQHGFIVILPARDGVPPFNQEFRADPAKTPARPK